MIAVSSIIVILSIAGAVIMAEEKMCSSFCSSLGMLQSSPGKSCADIYQINKASRGVSGLYWINTTSGLHQVTCDMELKCGGHNGGWTAIAKFDTSKGDSCPSGWTNITTPGSSPKLVCRSPNDDGGCYSAIFNTQNITFDRICGKVKGYQKGNSVGFYSGKFHKSINDVYVSGVSITLGDPRKHVWTYAAGVSDDGYYPDWNCPCAKTPGPDPPTFLGNHYYCESGNTGTYQSGDYHTADPLWDGDGCHDASNNCCTNLDMPWFFRQLSMPMHDYLEARICHLYIFGHDETLVESIELYIQ